MTADPRNLIRFVPAKGVQTRDLRPITTGGFVVLMHVEQVIIVADGRSDAEPADCGRAFAYPAASSLRYSFSEGLGSSWNIFGSACVQRIACTAGLLTSTFD